MAKPVYSTTKQVDEDLRKLRSGLEKLWTEFDAEADWPAWWPEDIDELRLDALKQSLGLCVPSFRPVFRKHKNSTEDRMADMVLGVPFTSADYPWPRDWPFAGKRRQRLWADGPFDENAEAEPLVPYLQVDLLGLSQMAGRNVGNGVLQIWHNPRVYEELLRVIPRKSFRSANLVQLATDEEETLSESFKAYSYDDSPTKFSSHVITEWQDMGIFTAPMFEEIFWGEHAWLAKLAKKPGIGCAPSAGRLYRSSQRSWDRVVPTPANNVRAFGFANTVNHDYLDAALDRWRLLLELKDTNLPWNWALGCGLVYFRRAGREGVPLPHRMSNVVRSGGCELVCTYQRV